MFQITAGRLLKFAIYEYDKSEKIDEMTGYLEKNVDLGEDLYGTSDKNRRENNGKLEFF